MSPEEVMRMDETTTEILNIVENDDTVNHCRINIVNGIKNTFNKYKESLAKIDGEYISVKFYNNHADLHEDLFVDKEFMSDDWFNLFVFNIGKNGKSLGYEIRGVDLITMELRSKFDSKFYSTMVISEMEKRELSIAFKQETGQKCPIENHRYLGYNFEAVEILLYLKGILHTHSTQFLSRWDAALKKLEKLSKQPVETVQEQGETYAN